MEPVINIEVNNSVPPMIKFIGEADYFNRITLNDAWKNIISEGHKTIRLDMEELRYIDSSALAALVGFAAAQKEAGGVLEIISASRQVAKALTQSGAAAFFKTLTMKVPLGGDKEKCLPSQNFWHYSDFDIPGSPDAVVIARNRIADLVRSLPITLNQSADVIIAAGEAITNAVRHGCKCDTNSIISIKCVAGPDMLCIDITDPGSGFEPDNIPTPAAESIVDGGMGIYIMKELMDDVIYSFDHGTTVRMTKYIDSPEDTYPTEIPEIEFAI